MRALGNSLVMCFHFVDQYGNSKVAPLMLTEDLLKPPGTFRFFSGVTLVGLGWMGFLPEKATETLEAMDEMFSLSLWIIGRKGAAMTAGSGGPADASSAGDIEKMAQAEVAGMPRTGRRVARLLLVFDA